MLKLRAVLFANNISNRILVMFENISIQEQIFFFVQQTSPSPEGHSVLSLRSHINGIGIGKVKVKASTQKGWHIIYVCCYLKISTENF